MARVVLANSASSVNFSSIPGTYRDLVLIVNCIPSSNAAPRLFFNSDTTSGNYFYITAYGTGSATASFSGTGPVGFGNLYSGTQNLLRFNMMDYSAADKHKHVLTRGDTSANLTEMVGARWANTAPITSISCQLSTGSFNAGSTFHLYGVNA
jgi:hypothetical protein